MSAVAPALPKDESDTYKRLHQDLVERGATKFRFVRVTGPYYEEPLEFRAQRLSARSTDQLCKTMVMENTKVTEHCSDPRLSKFFLVLVQYTAAIDAEKVKAFVHKVRQADGLHACCGALNVAWACTHDRCVCFTQTWMII